MKSRAQPPSAEARSEDDFLSVRRRGRWTIPVLRRKPALVLLAVFIGLGLLQASGLVLSSHGRIPPLVFLGHATGALGSWLALPPVLFAVVNAPSPAIGWTRFVLTHLSGYATFVLLHLCAMFSLRWGLWASFGLGVIPRDLLSFVAYDAQNDLLVYSAIAGIVALLYGWQERKVAALRASQLDAKLAEARLEALTARLDPHFLFNGLNTVSALMYEDLPRTERLLAGLGEILRDTLRASGPFWTLDREWAHTLRYLELVVARFEERLQVHCEAAPDLERFQVPRFTVQTLVENAIKHNADRPEPLQLSVSLTTDSVGVKIVVEDNGRGFAASESRQREEGNLTRLREVLQLAYGDRAQLECGNRMTGGARVCLALMPGE